MLGGDHTVRAVVLTDPAADRTVRAVARVVAVLVATLATAATAVGEVTAVQAAVQAGVQAVARVEVRGAGSRVGIANRDILTEFTSIIRAVVPMAATVPAVVRVVAQ